MLAEYRRHAALVIMTVAAVITPPDIMTLVLVAIPLYMLYEVSIRVVAWVTIRMKPAFPPHYFVVPLRPKNANVQLE